MSQKEVLICLMNLGGKATIADLADEYNRIHFPNNIEYRQLKVKDVKKTMQSDTSKLIRDRMIRRLVTKPFPKDPHIINRIIVWYEITEYGWKIIDADRLQKVQQVHNLRN
jgi:hypothetical protein